MKLFGFPKRLKAMKVERGVIGGQKGISGDGKGPEKVVGGAVNMTQVHV